MKPRRTDDDRPAHHRRRSHRSGCEGHAFAYLKGLVALEGGGFAVLDSQIFDLTMTLVDSLPLPSDGPKDEELDPANQPGAFYQEMGGGYMAYSIPFYASEVRYIDGRDVFWSSRDGDSSYRFQRSTRLCGGIWHGWPGRTSWT